MKYLLQFVAVALLGVCVGCGSSVQEVAPVTEGSGPSGEEVQKMAEESMKHMPTDAKGQHADKMGEMMKKAVESAPGESPPSQ